MAALPLSKKYFSIVLSNRKPRVRLEREKNSLFIAVHDLFQEVLYTFPKSYEIPITGQYQTLRVCEIKSCFGVNEKHYTI